MISSNDLNSVDLALNQAINFVAQNIGCYSRDPGIDFTRRRNLPPEVLMKMIIQLQSKSIRSELSDFFLAGKPPTASAFCQQRDKLDPEALERVLHLLSDNAPRLKTFHGYRLLACDGSDVNTPYNPDDLETFIQPDDAKKGYNQLHLNALFDTLNGIYTDAMIDTKRKSHESGALLDMLKRFPLSSDEILTADRGYERYELIAFMVISKMLFAIRLKDIDSNGIISGLNLPDGEFDIDVTRILTRRQTKEVKANRQTYAFLPSSVDFSYLDADHETFELHFRLTRFKITEDTYECLLTNLPRDKFPPPVMKELYHCRWIEENSFRNLKYSVGMVYFHSKKQHNIRQEIFAALILYNYTQLLINAVPVEKEGKWKYKAAFATAVTNARLFLKHLIKVEDMTVRIKSFLIPIRPGRQFTRNIKGQSAKLFLYRAS